MEELCDEYSDKISDRHYFPTKTDVRTLWRSNFRQQYGERSGPEMLKKLEDVLTSENERNGTLFKRFETRFHNVKMDMTSSRRSVNFSEEEIAALTAFVETYKHILENNKTDAVTTKKKDAMWEIASEWAGV
ncbi:unnamed protein product [Ceutorhynchus assimilis]|uniref:Regulatory protein zeste n=1 Tax=Ceutorhynchus assimilis TaxID=467358 RepID=A0A9N9MSR7_9CUCU|nr:unnamed protein product [Ceutorhynchus assimilis]